MRVLLATDPAMKAPKKKKKKIKSMNGDGWHGPECENVGLIVLMLIGWDTTWVAGGIISENETILPLVDRFSMNQVSGFLFYS